MALYKLKDALEIYTDPESIHFQINDKHLTYDKDENFLKLLGLLENLVSLEQIKHAFLEIDSTVSEEEVEGALESLRDNALLEVRNSFQATNDMHNENRFARQINFWNNFDLDNNWNGIDVQKKLGDSKVVVLGLGGIGSWVASTLAMSGVGELVLIDGDSVEESNLTRQNLYNSHDLGMKKTTCMSGKLKSIYPVLEVKTYEIFVEDRTDLTPCFDGADLIISCIDFPSVTETGKWVSKAAFNLNIPHIISGGYNGHQGFIGPTIIPGETVCWECIAANVEQEYADWVVFREPKKIGSIGPFSAAVANIQVWEGLQILAGVKKTVMQNKKGEWNFSNLDLKLFEYESFDDCTKCQNLLEGGKQ